MSPKAVLPPCLESTGPIDDSSILDRLRHLGQNGWFRHAIPSAVGGYGDGFSELVAQHRDVGRTTRDTGLVLGLNAHLWGGLFPLLNYGTPDQQARYFPRLLSGEWIAGHAMTEPEAGSDIYAMQSVARKLPDGYSLTAHKRFITNTPIADMLVVYVMVEGGLTAFLVERGDAGVRFETGPRVEAFGSAAIADVVIDDAKLGPDRVLGKMGAGALMMQGVMELERAFFFAGIAGVMAWQLRFVCQHARRRQVGGKPLAARQAISHRIARMQLRADTLDLWLDACARKRDSGQRISLLAAQCKLFGSEAFLENSLDAVHILGGQGLLPDAHMGKLVGDAVAGRLLAGSSEIQLNLMAKWLSLSRVRRPT